MSDNSDWRKRNAERLAILLWLGVSPRNENEFLMYADHIAEICDADNKEVK